MKLVFVISANCVSCFLLVIAQQLSDPDIGILLVELEVTNKRPKWESVSSGTSALKTLWCQWDPEIYVPSGALFVSFFGFLCKASIR
jgi:hypothetical protein